MFEQERLERGQTLAGGRRIVVEQLERTGVHGQSTVFQTPSGVQQQQRSQAVVPWLTPQRQRRRRRRGRYRPGRPVVGDHGRRQQQVRLAAAAATASPVATSPDAAPSSVGLAAGTAVVRRFTPTAGSVRRRRRDAVPATDVAATKRRRDGRRTSYGYRGRRRHSAVPASQSAATRRAAPDVAVVRRGRRRLRRPLSDVRELLSLLLAGK